MVDRLVYALSLCRKGGALVMGYDAVKQSVLEGRAQLVMCTADASPGTARRVAQLCRGRCEYRALAVTMQQLVPVAKKATAVYAVDQADFARLCRMQLEREPTMKEERP